MLGCIAVGAAYFSKLPGKKAACEVFSELQLDGQGPARSAACTPLDVCYRSDLNAARISVANSSGSSQAAKWPPLPASLK